MHDAAPSGRELDILKVLWEIGPATVREVRARLCPDGELAFNTVQTLLRIMDDKGLVRHTNRGRIFVYEPTRTRQREAARFVDRVFDGALDQFVVSMLQGGDVGPAELKRLEEIISQARGKKRKPKGG